MAVTAFCRPRRSPFIATAAGPGLGPRPAEAAAEEAGTAGTRPGWEGGGGEGCKDSPAVIQRRLRAPRGPVPHRTPDCRFGPAPSPPFSFSPRPLVSPQAPLHSSSLWDCISTLGAGIHRTPFLCLFILPPLAQLSSPPPDRLASFLALRTLIPTAFSSFIFYPLLFLYPFFYA